MKVTRQFNVPTGIILTALDEKALDMLISKISCTKASNFIGLRTPRMFK